MHAGTSWFYEHRRVTEYCFTWWLFITNFYDDIRHNSRATGYACDQLTLHPCHADGSQKTWPVAHKPSSLTTMLPIHTKRD